MESAEVSKLFQVVETGGIYAVTNFINEIALTTDLINLKSVIDQRNEYNQTVLHIGSGKLFHSILQILLEAGSDPNVQDVEGRTPAYCVVARLQECNCEDCMKKAIRCLNILSCHGASLDIPDKNEVTPLYLSAEYRLTDCTKALLENGAALGTSKGRPMIEILVEKVPSALETIFDRAVKITANKSIHDPEFEMKFDLSVILPPKITLSNQLHGNGSNGSINKVYPAEQWFGENYEACEEMVFLKQLLKNTEHDSTTYKSLCRHPLVNVFTDMKWKSLQTLYFFFLILQISVLIAYSAFIFATIFLNCPYNLFIKIKRGLEKINSQAFPNDNFNVTEFIDPEHLCEIGIISKVLSIFVVLFTLFVLLKEVQHAIYDIKEYLKDIFNYFQLIGFITVIFTVIVAWDRNSRLYLFLYPASALGIVLSWCQIFVQVGKLPQLGIYVEMFVKVSVNFCLSISIYSFLLIGFAMSYSILFPVNPQIWDLPLSIIKTLTMFVGELDYEDLFKSDDSGGAKEKQPTSSQDSPKHTVSGLIWYVTFVVFVTLILMNLLVGLAVSDIQGIRKNAEIYVIKRRIKYIAYLEKVLYEVTMFIPNFMKKYFRENIAIARPNKSSTRYLCCFCQPVDITNCKLKIWPNKPEHRFLSNESKTSIRNWCMSKSVSEISRKCRRLQSGSSSGFRKRNMANLRKCSTSSFFGKQVLNKDKDTIPTDTDRLKWMEFNVQQMDVKISELDQKMDLIVKALTRPDTPDAY